MAPSQPVFTFVASCFLALRYFEGVRCGCQSHPALSHGGVLAKRWYAAMEHGVSGVLGVTSLAYEILGMVLLDAGGLGWLISMQRPKIAGDHQGRKLSPTLALTMSMLTLTSL